MSNATYKLLSTGYIQDLETGAFHPASRGNHLSNAVIETLINAGVALEDKSGALVFKPDNVLLSQDTPVETEVSEEKPKTTKSKSKTTGAA